MSESFSCKCNNGYSGDGFSCADINAGADGSNSCDYKSACIINDGGYTCDWPFWIRKRRLKLLRYHRIITGQNKCDMNATCSNIAGGFTFTCNNGNDSLCADFNEGYGANSCDANAYCDNTDGGYDYECNAGYARNENVRIMCQQ